MSGTRFQLNLQFLNRGTFSKFEHMFKSKRLAYAHHRLEFNLYKDHEVAPSDFSQNVGWLYSLSLGDFICVMKGVSNLLDQFRSQIVITVYTEEHRIAVLVFYPFVRVIGLLLGFLYKLVGVSES
jgi:hypothetical protein